MNSSLLLGLNAVIIAVTDEEPRILTVASDEAARLNLPSGDSDAPALPFGPLEPTHDRTLALALRRWVKEQTKLELGYIEQLYTFGDRDRLAEGRELEHPPRVISVAYLALVREHSTHDIKGVKWRGLYDFLPWEDWRNAEPAMLEDSIVPGLRYWIEASETEELRDERQERVDIAFGRGGAPWDEERVLERYELLYEAGLVQESGVCRESPLSSEAMTLDHRRILSTALSRLRGKIRYRPVVFELLPDTFTLFQLQRVVEALAGQRLHKQNFRRLVEKGGLVEATGDVLRATGGRPAALFEFRREVLRERLAPGVGLPGRRQNE
jgi:hypothetical protein